MRTKKKNNNITFLAIVAMILTVIALIATSGTYAKYTSSIQGTTATATIAKWKVVIDANNQEYLLGRDTTFDFNLFDTINDTNGGNESDVLIDDEGYVCRIAPGTSGTFSLGIDNQSEVTVNYSISLTEQNPTLSDGETTLNIPIKYALEVDGDEPTADDYTNAAGLAAAIQAATTDPLAIGSEKTLVIHWKWDYEDNQDANDTLIGNEAQSGTLQYKVSAVITATQAD